MARSSGKMRLLPLIAATYFMVSGGPYGLEDIIGDAGYARAILLLLLVPIFWSLPTALMIGELATAIPSDGGFYHWVRRAMGPFWGFQEAWLSLAASVFDMAIYPTTFVLYLTRVAPSLTSGHRGLFLKFAIVAIACLWNLRGAVSVGGGSLRLMALSLSPFVLLLGIAAWHILTRAASPSSAALPQHPDLSAALLVALWNYMGWDNASTIAAEVGDPVVAADRAVVAVAEWDAGAAQPGVVVDAQVPKVLVRIQDGQARHGARVSGKGASVEVAGGRPGFGACFTGYPSL